MADAPRCCSSPGRIARLFLINFIPFLLLPGLIFSVFTRLGVRPRVAWHWMWLLPTGYNFLLQAGSLGNDTFPTVYALAAVDFGLRAWASRRPADLWYSLLAAALLTGAKASNLPLLLPWAIVVLRAVAAANAPAGHEPRWWCCWRRWSPFSPRRLLNLRYCGDWSGLALEHAGMDMKNPFVGIWGNALLLLMKNFVPTVLPAGRLVEPVGAVHPAARADRPRWWRTSRRDFFYLGEMPTEDWVGLGLRRERAAGGLRAGRLRAGPAANRGWTGSRLIPRAVRWGVLVAPWVSLLAYTMKSGMVTPARLISPYYPLLLPLLLVGARQAEIVRRRWWRAMAWGVVLLALPVLVLTPGRPLWPAQTVLSKLLAWKPDQRAAHAGPDGL